MKKISKICVIILQVCFLFSIIPHASASIMNVAVYGDINDDLKAGIEDVTYIQRYLVNLYSFTGYQIEAADYNHDGAITIEDATFIQRNIVNIKIPEGFGGWFEPYSTANLVYADYSSGKAMVGIPVTFTMQGGYPYDNDEPSAFYDPITYNVEIFDYSQPRDENGRYNPIISHTSTQNEFTYTFEKAGNYQITVIISDRFDNETYYNCNYSVVEPYSIDHPVVASVYTDKPRYYNAFVEDSFVPYSNWQEMSLYIKAIGGSGEYEYSFELIAGEDSIYKNYSKDNSFTIERKDFPGLKEYQIIQTENRTHWNEPEYIEQHYDWHNVKPYELHITVRDSNGDVITETVTIEAIQDFDMS